MYLTLIKNIILWFGWIFIIGGTIYILLRGRSVLVLVKGSIVGKLAMGLMFGFFVETYAVLILCTVLLVQSENNIDIVLPIFIIWLLISLNSWWVMRKTRQAAEKIMAGG